MNLTAISICVNYSDYFCWTALANRSLFNRWIVVTDTKDYKTKQICSYYGIECIQTDIFYEDGGFGKFKGINVGLEKAGKNKQILFLDCDIVLPPITKRVLDNIKIDKDCLYGIDRLNLKSFEKWIQFCNYPNLIIDNWLMTSANGEFGSRINHYYGQQGDNGKFGGWSPLGFFQLAHSSFFKSYPDNCIGADRCDMEFAKKYPREQRVHIPEIMGLHLESEGANWGANWFGRTSNLFFPKEYNINITDSANSKNSSKDFKDFKDSKDSKFSY